MEKQLFAQKDLHCAGMAHAGPQHILQLAWGSYLAQLNRKPLRTKALTSAFIAGLSDVIAQRIVSGGYKSYKRTLALAIYGLVWNGPSAHYWQAFIEKLFRGASGGFQTVLKKVIVDQCSYGPLCNILFMSYATIVLEGKSLSFLQNKIKSEYPRVQLSGWRVWPVAALFSYAFVPLHLRVLFINCVALFWSTYLLMRAKSMAKQAAASAASGTGAGAQQSKAAAESKGGKAS